MVYTSRRLPAVVDLTAATYTATQANQSEGIMTLNRAAGITVTLPAATGTGDTYTYIVGTTVTSNSYKIQAASASDIMTGFAKVLQDGGDTAVHFETASDTDTITMNGTTTGGLKGAKVVLMDIGTGLWHVDFISAGTGTEATPFSAAVS